MQQVQTNRQSRRTASVFTAALPFVLLVLFCPAVALADEPQAGADPSRPKAVSSDGVAIAATLAEQLKTTRVPLLEDYAEARPRLLFGPADRERLAAKAEKQKDMWAEVLKKAATAGASNVPTDDVIEGGKTYWRIERVQSAALTHFVTGQQRYASGAAVWMLAHGKVDTWGTGYRPNVDLAASWYLYHIAIAYDALHSSLSEADRAVIRKGLADHAAAIAVGLREGEDRGIRYEQNHTYIPATALTAAALALKGEVAEADDWLNLSWAIMMRSRYALGEDGYYYEGTGYWAYALHWHVRWAEMMSRATGRKLMELPALSENWRYALLMTLPGAPGVFDIGDTSMWRDGVRPTISLPNTSMLRAVAGQLKRPEQQTAGDLMYQRQPETDYPAAAFLWHDETVEAAPLAKIDPWHHFKDHDVVAWRSGWDSRDSAFVFRCGPPQGHAATEKLEIMKDWTMNSGHVHPDIGAFWIYARSNYLAVDTGYLDQKWTRNHNTLLVGGKGQGIDGSYWNDRGWPYRKFDQARITVSRLQKDYGYASGEFSSIYPEELGLKNLRRSVVMTANWMIVIDDMQADQPQTLTWLCHSDSPFEQVAGGDGASAVFLSRTNQAGLAVLPLGPTAAKGKNERTVVIAGTSPGRGKEMELNHHLRLDTEAATRQRLVTVVAILADGQAPPAARLVKSDDKQVTVEISRSVEGQPAVATTVSIDLATGELKHHDQSNPSR